MGWKTEVLDLIEEMKRESSKPRRAHLDRLAADLISQEHVALKMADNLGHWLRLSEPAVEINKA